MKPGFTLKEKLIVWGASLGLVFLAGSMSWAMKVGPKLEVCRAYYPEISKWSCFWSDYGLPHRSGK